jgi:DNA (cytosine-5)-methyltransferase 1
MAELPKFAANPSSERLEWFGSIGRGEKIGTFTKPGWWEVEPDVDRVVDGLPNRVDRLKCLGNAVVPLQARTAFEILMGLRGPKPEGIFQ